MNKPSKRDTRTRSQTQKIQEEMSILETKRKLFIDKVIRMQKQFDDQNNFANWSKGILKERIKILEDANSNLDIVQLEMVCKDELSAEQTRENIALEELIVKLKGKANDRIDELSKNSKTMNAQEPIRVIQTDAAGNIPNTWGTFNGDYGKWQSFRDRWMPVHENKDIKAVIKFHNLKTACIDAAVGALGEWDITEENYYKAFDRLSSIYEDDYMQVQAYMQKLITLPPMRNNSSKTIRDTIDVIQQHIAGISRYVDIDKKHPYAVFAVINKMDSDTFRAWEKFRPGLAKNDANQNDANAEAIAPRSGKHIPTWQELEQFLEGEVTIRVHAEKRISSDCSGNQREEFKQNSPHEEKRFKAEKTYSDFVICEKCQGNHPLYKCEIFRSMNLAGRKDTVSENDLCEQCLRKSHNGRCEYEKCNAECLQCKPKTKFHNSLLCPNTELSNRIAYLAHENNEKGNKRKYKDKKAKH